MVLREFVSTGAEGGVSGGGGRSLVEINGEAATVQIDEVGGYARAFDVQLSDWVSASSFSTHRELAAVYPSSPAVDEGRSWIKGVAFCIRLPIRA
jgi:hypothetical protein